MNKFDEEYAYKTIEEYESLTDFKVNEAFKLGWRMARVKNKHLGIEEKNEDTE